MIAGPNTLIILRKWVGQIYQTHGVAKEGGRYTAVCVCTKSKVLDPISLHCGIVRKVGRSAFRLEARQNYCQGVYIVAVRKPAIQLTSYRKQVARHGKFDAKKLPPSTKHSRSILLQFFETGTRQCLAIPFIKNV